MELRAPILALLAVVLAGNAGCGNLFGPDLEGAPFVEIKVNGHPWQVTRMVGLSPGSPGFGFFADHVPSDSGQVRYELSAYLADFHGADDYTVTSDNPRQQVLMFGSGSDGGHREYQTVSTDPGKVIITGYRQSDSTAVGIFAVRLHLLTIPASNLSEEIEVTGTFRVRPGD